MRATRISKLTSQASGRQDRQRAERRTLRVIETVEVTDHGLVHVDVLDVEELRYLHRTPVASAIDTQVELVMGRRTLGVHLAVDRIVEIRVAVVRCGDDPWRRAPARPGPT